MVDTHLDEEPKIHVSPPSPWNGTTLVLQVADHEIKQWTNENVDLMMPLY